jgi:O-6-methylguanine DNA methyltransferase
MDRIDAMLGEFFKPEAPPRLSERLLGRLRARPANLEKLADRFRIDATERGVARLYPGRGDHGASARARGHAERARQELREYLAGRRTFFTVAVDLDGVGDFQARVLAEANRIQFGEVDSYSALARRVGHPRAARAVGNALGSNPVPVIVPCHRIVRGDGTWGHYAFGGAMKTQLLRLERTTPALIGCTSTRIICRRGCAHEQRVGEANRIVFASVADAASVGYRPCRVCRPPVAA